MTKPKPFVVVVRCKASAWSLALATSSACGVAHQNASGEPSDADLFLTGTDEETLVAQAKRLADRAAEKAAAEAERKKNNPIVSKEGTSTKTGTTTEEADREYARSFFNGGSS